MEHRPSSGGGSFVVERDGERLATMTWHDDRGVIVITHTEVSPKLRGQGIGQALVAAAVGMARAEGRKIRPLCTYARSVMDKDASTADVRVP